MRYKIRKYALLSRMREYEQNYEQQIKYLMHNISTYLEKYDFEKFDIVAKGYFIYQMMLQESFCLIRLNYIDCFIIVQNSEHEWIIEIRKKNG